MTGLRLSLAGEDTPPQAATNGTQKPPLATWRKPRLPPPPAVHPTGTDTGTEAERGVLSSIMQEAIRGRDCARSAMEIAEAAVSEAHFTLPAHREVWRAMKSLHRDNESMDFVSVTLALEDSQTISRAGGASYIADLDGFCPTGINLDHYLQSLKNKYRRRAVADIGKRLLDSASDPRRSADAAIADLRKIADTDTNADDYTETFTAKSLLEYPYANDPNSVLGSRWLCKGSQCLWLGPSGIGKSTLCFQAAMYWSLGIPFFGIAPKKPLKSIIFQAEDDIGDCSEFYSGLLEGLQKVEQLTMPPAKMLELLTENFIVIRDVVHRGADFCKFAKRKITELRADMLWINPLFSYAGCPVSDQAMMSAFLRDCLTPVIMDTGAVCHVVHHVPKPSTDAKARQSWSDSDFAYMGFGSSEITNWARAINYIEPCKDGPFKLRLAKRGNRAGATPDPAAKHEHGSTIFLQHHDEFIYWLQVPPPKEALDKKRASDAKQASELTGLRWPNTYTEITKSVQNHFKCSHDAAKKRVTRWIKSCSISEKTDGSYEIQK